MGYSACGLSIGNGCDEAGTDRSSECVVVWVREDFLVARHCFAFPRGFLVAVFLAGVFAGSFVVEALVFGLGLDLDAGVAATFDEVAGALRERLDLVGSPNPFANSARVSA